MTRREMTTGPWLAVMTVAIVVLLGVGCATGSDADRQGPDEVVGQPPEEESEDYEFAPPPEHPGEHGSVASADDGAQPEHDAEPGVVTESDIDRLQNFGPSVVMQHVDAEPVHDDDDFVGFEIVDVSATAEHYIEEQLEVGDVITHVNLVRLERPDDYMEAWETLEGADEIRVDIVRDGEPEEITWEIE